MHSLRIPKQEKERFTAIADRLLDSRPLAGQAVQRAMSVYRRVQGDAPPVLPVPLLLTVLTGISAFAYAAAYRNLTPQKAAALFPEAGWQKLPDPKDLASFLLCAPGGLSFGEAAPFLELSPVAAEKRYNSALRSLGLSGKALQTAAERARRKAAFFLPSVPPASSAGHNPGRHWGWAAAGFAALDIAGILTAAGVIVWSRGFLAPAAPAPEPLSIAAPGRAEGTTLNQLYYTLPVPDGFRLAGHLRTDQEAHSEYTDDAGHTITFSQQISPEPVVGFSPSSGFESVTFRGHDAALLSADGSQQIFWFNEYYCYTLSANLPRDKALALAESIRMGEDRTTQALPLSSLPMLYTQRLAVENGDILIGDFINENTKRIELFVKNWESKGQDFIRIAEFREDGSVILTDLQTEGGAVYCTQDTRRAVAGPRQEWGAAYDRMTIGQQNGHSVLYLESDGWDEPFAAVVYD